MLSSTATTGNGRIRPSSSRSREGSKCPLNPTAAWSNSTIRFTDGSIRLVSFVDYDLGYFDDQTCRLEPIEDPFGPKNVTHVFGMICNACVRNGP